MSDSNWFTRAIGKAKQIGKKVIGKTGHALKSVIGKIEPVRRFVEEHVPEPIRDAVTEAVPYGHEIVGGYKAARSLAKALPDDNDGSGYNPPRKRGGGKSVPSRRVYEAARRIANC